MSGQLEFVLDNLPNFLFGFPNHRPGGLLLTLVLVVVAMVVGLVVSVAVAFALDSRSSWGRRLASGYVQVVRGIPLVLWLLIVFTFWTRFAVLGIRATPLWAAFVTLTIYSSAYQADIIHTGARAVPDVLVDDARLLGASRTQVYRLVRLAYSARVMTPALTGQAVTVFKDSSVVVILGVAELTTTARLALGADVTNASYWVAAYLSVGALYFVVAFGFSRFARRLELRIRSEDLVHSLAKLA